MGFSVSGATAVVFIGLLVSAATLYPAVDRYTERRGDALAADDERSLTRQNTGIDITAAATSGNVTTLTVEIENTGASTLAVSEVDLLVDGTVVIPDQTSVEGSTTTDVWAPGEVLTLTVAGQDASRVKVTTGPGVAATSEVA
jgi:flagellar protein FlaF